MESRVVPASGPVSSRSSPSRWLISVDLPALGRPTMATRIGRCRAASSSVFARLRRLLVFLRRLRHQRAQRVVEFAKALAVLGRNRDRLAETERIGLDRAGLAVLALALVGDQQHRLVGAADEIGEGAIGRRQSGAGIDHEQQRVRELDRGLGLLLHARGQRALGALVEARSVDDREFEIAEPRLAFAPVARDAGHVIDQRELPPDQPVEQGRFADIRPADDGNRE